MIKLTKPCSVLWTTYTETAYHLEAYLGPHPTTTVALAGGMAGAAQACAAAPVENVRLIIEGRSSQVGWSHAWKEVFLRSDLSSSSSKQESIQKAREIRDWMKDIRDMAGRGWEGWGWGLAKDTCGEEVLCGLSTLYVLTGSFALGFAVFFTIFEITRQSAVWTRTRSESLVSDLYSERKEVQTLKRHAPKAIHGITLVAGGVAAGVAYEVCSRPWDSARRAVYVDRVTAVTATPPRTPSAFAALAHKVRDEGLLSFLRDPSASPTDVSRSTSDRLRSRLIAMSRMLARVGPWGVGFLVWESLGPGIS
jgi:hypothetical protein